MIKRQMELVLGWVGGEVMVNVALENRERVTKIIY